MKLLDAALAAGQPAGTLPEKAPHVLICTPCHSGKVDLNYHISMTMAMSHMAQHGIQYSTDYNVGMTVDNARSEMATLFLRKMPQCTHLLFIDDDLCFSPDLPYRLLRENVDIVGVPYRRKISTTLYNMRHGVRVKTIPGRPHMIVVDNIATGFLLIKRNVFERLAPKVVEYRYNDKGETGLLFFRHEVVEDEMIGGTAYMGEDYNFCRLAKENGIDTWAYVDEDIAHIGNYPYRGNYKEFAEKGGYEGKFDCPDPHIPLRLLFK